MISTLQKYKNTVRICALLQCDKKGILNHRGPRSEKVLVPRMVALCLLFGIPERVIISHEYAADTVTRIVSGTENCCITGVEFTGITVVADTEIAIYFS